MTLLAVALVAALGGAVNSIAGGGTLLTFPSLIALGIPPIVANATSTVALWPGALASMWGYRRQLAGVRAWAIRFAIPSLLGGLAGALLLLNTPAERFSQIVPWLVLGATLLFMAQGPVMERLRKRRAARALGVGREPESRVSAGWAGAGVGVATEETAASQTGPSMGEGAGIPRFARDDRGLAREDRGVARDDRPALATAPPPALDPARTDEPLPPPPFSFLLYQFLVGIYGGYFGAGVGILMLAALGMMGLANIHRMNGLKNWGGMCMNAVAAVTFIVSGLVDWPVALAMAVGAILGGYGGAHLAQRVGQQPVRKAIIAIGLLSTVWLAFGR